MSIHKKRSQTLGGQRLKIKGLSIVSDIITTAFTESQDVMTAQQKNVLNKEVNLLRIYDKQINMAKQQQIAALSRLDELSKQVTRGQNDV